MLRAGKIVFVALRAIAPGEEITLDYGEEYYNYHQAARLPLRRVRARKKS